MYVADGSISPYPPFTLKAYGYFNRFYPYDRSPSPKISKSRIRELFDFRDFVENEGDGTVDFAFIEYCSWPWRGWSQCEVCQPRNVPSKGQAPKPARIKSGSIFVIPNVCQEDSFFSLSGLIGHHIIEHCYAPPDEVIQSLLRFDPSNSAQIAEVKKFAAGFPEDETSKLMQSALDDFTQNWLVQQREIWGE